MDGPDSARDMSAGVDRLPMGATVAAAIMQGVMKLLCNSKEVE